MKRIRYGEKKDDQGRTIFYFGGDKGKCRACGAGPHKKYSENGTHVFYHVPAQCQRHDRAHAAKDRPDLAHIYRGGE